MLAGQMISKEERHTKVHVQQAGSKVKKGIGMYNHADIISSSNEETSHDYCLSKKYQIMIYL